MALLATHRTRSFPYHDPFCVSAAVPSQEKEPWPSFCCRPASKNNHENSHPDRTFLSHARNGPWTIKTIISDIFKHKSVRNNAYLSILFSGYSHGALPCLSSHRYDFEPQGHQNSNPHAVPESAAIPPLQRMKHYHHQLVERNKLNIGVHMVHPNQEYSNKFLT
jgi:hypothetical protein